MQAKESLSIAGYPVRSTTSTALANELLNAVEKREQRVLFFANTNFVVLCRQFLSALRDDSVTIVNDGIGMDIAAWLMLKRRFAENLNGTDFTPFLFKQATAPLRVFLLGGKPEVLTRAVAHVEQKLGQSVVGQCDGYQGMREANDLVATINRSGAQVVLVAMGNPRQEQWILAHRARLDASLLIGVGALFDFWAGDKPRAPIWIRRVKLEWFYRLCLEPRRLLKRYTVDIVKFLLLCRKYR